MHLYAKVESIIIASIIILVSVSLIIRGWINTNSLFWVETTLLLGTISYSMFLRIWPKEFKLLNIVHCIFGLFLTSMIGAYIFLVRVHYFFLEISWFEFFSGIFVVILAATGLILRLFPYAGYLRYFSRSLHNLIAGLLLLIFTTKIVIFFF